MPLTQLVFNSIASSSEIVSALLTKQFFPNVKSTGEELPPFFGSETLTEALAELLQNCQPQRAGYVSIRARRFDGLTRSLGVPHPVPFSKLVLHVRDNWNDLEDFLTSPESMIRPHRPRSDGRILIMDYGSTREKTLAETIAALGKRYSASADISNCFPSLYSHAIDWALRGHATAKSSRNDGSWEAKLDFLNQNCHRGETTGVMIGPAAFNLVSEVVLQRIDDELRREGYSFTRYIDDYTAYFETREAAEGFIQHLDRALLRYNLRLNTKKTRVDSLAAGLGEAWVSELQSRIPKGRGDLGAVRFLQYCENLAAGEPNRSTLTYGVKALLNRRRCPPLGTSSDRVPRRSDKSVLFELVRISFFHPHLMPHVCRQLSFTLPLLTGIDKDLLASSFSRGLEQAIRRAETDVILWVIYALRILLRRRIRAAQFDRLVELQDDLVTLACAVSSKVGHKRAMGFARSLNQSDATTLHEHWLLRYEMYRLGVLKDTDLADPDERSWFRLAKGAGLSFLR